MDDSSYECAIAVEKKEDFCASPPFGWYLDPETGKMKCTDNSFIVLVRDGRFEGRDVSIEVNDLEETSTLRRLLGRKPIITTAHCHKSFTAPQNSPALHKPVDFVVLINTAHPLIAAQLDAAFQTAEECLKERKMFRITVAFSESLRHYMDNIDFMGQSHSETTVWNCDIVLTHGVSEPRCADHFFACKTRCQTAVWFLCFPCCLLTGFPYILYKNCVTRGFKDETIKHLVPVTYHDGPFMTGFDLHSLLFTSNKTTVISQHAISSPPEPSFVPIFIPGSPEPGPSHKGKKPSKHPVAAQKFNW